MNKGRPRPFAAIVQTHFDEALTVGVLDQPPAGLHQPLLQAGERPVLQSSWAAPAAATDYPGCRRSG
jgi:hypothetical protein